MEQDKKDKKEAYWEIEIMVPCSCLNPEDFDLPENLINKVGHCHSTEMGFGERDAVGDVYFETYEEALQWKQDTQEFLDMKISQPSLIKPKVYCGVWVHSKEDDEEWRDYYEIMGNDIFECSNDGDTFTYEELVIQKS